MYLDLVALRGSAPLRRENLSLVQSKSVTTPCRLPSQTRFSEAAFSSLLGQIKIDVVKGLPDRVLVEMDLVCRKIDQTSCDYTDI